ncbi:MAG: glycosyltransferase family 2 protein [Acidobacteriota bacterium]
MQLSIVVVTWRSRDFLPRCLDSLRAHAAGAEVVVVENGSGDGTPEFLLETYPEVRALCLPRNLGFAAGCNRGIAASSGDMVLLLNPDAQATAGSVPALAAALADHPEAAAIGGLLVNPNGRPQRRYAPSRFPDLNDLSRMVLVPGSRRGLPIPSGTDLRQVQQVAGACLLVRRAAARRVGGFDEGFTPVWFEDVDFCLRLHQAGFRILHHPGATFIHQGAGSVSKMDARSYYAAWYQNLQRYGLKHHGRAAASLLRALTLPGAGMRLAATLLPGGAGPFGRGPRAAAYMRVASRSVVGWPSVSRSMS